MRAFKLSIISSTQSHSLNKIINDATVKPINNLFLVIISHLSLVCHYSRKSYTLNISLVSKRNAKVVLRRES